MSREIRQMKKTKASKTKEVLGRTSVSTTKEGVGGDIRVRQGDKGPRIEAKLGNTWYSADLSPINASSSSGTSKVWIYDGVTPNKYDNPGTANDVGKFGDEMFVKLPDFLNSANITSVSLMINMGGTHYHAWTWDTPGTSPNTDGTANDTRSNSGASTSDINRVEVSYHRKKHEIALLNIGHEGPSYGSKNSKFRLAVYYF